MAISPSLLIIAFAGSFFNAPVISSSDKDDREFLLEKISRLEDDVLQLKQILLDFMAEGKPRVNRVAETDFVASMVTQHDQAITNLISDVQGLRELTGSTFVRWGKNECPDNATLVYRGFTSASHYDDTASTPNRLCLTDTPGFDNTDMYGDFYQRVFGAEYFVTGPNHTVVPCAVCRTPQPTTIMVPGTWNCSEGWDTQYIGHIIGHFFTDIRASEYICLDAEPEDVDGNEAGWDSGLAMYAIISCGSLPCPPYEADEVVTCVVCSK